MLNKQFIGWKTLQIEKYTKQRNYDYATGVVLVITMFILIILFSMF